MIIGLGKYEDRSWGKINGDRDVALVTSMLKNARFNTIITLVNSQATKKKIISAFNSLACQSKESDIVYIHFSGHGQQMTDLMVMRKMEKTSPGFPMMLIKSLVIKIMEKNIFQMMKYAYFL